MRLHRWMLSINKVEAICLRPEIQAIFECEGEQRGYAEISTE